MKEIYIVEAFEIVDDALEVCEILDVFDTVDEAKEFIVKNVKNCVVYARELGVSSEYTIDLDAIVFHEYLNGEGVQVYSTPTRSFSYVYTKWMIK